MEQIHLLKTGKRELAEDSYGELSRICKDMVLYVIYEVCITQNDISEEKQGLYEENGRSKGDLKHDEGVCKSTYIERKGMFKNMRCMRRKIILHYISLQFIAAFCWERVASKEHVVE